MVETFLSEHKDLELKDFFDWQIEASKSFILEWAQLYHLNVYAEKCEKDFILFYAIAEDMAVLFHFIEVSALTYKISANTYDYHEKQSHPIRKTGTLGSIFGRGHTCETVLNMLFRLNEKKKLEHEIKNDN